MKTLLFYYCKTPPFVTLAFVKLRDQVFMASVMFVNLTARDTIIKQLIADCRLHIAMHMYCTEYCTALLITFGNW